MDKLTREQILNMPAGREMDALVAEILGWEVDDLTAYSPTRSANSRTHHGDDDWLPYYSTDITAAFEVVNEMQRRNYWFYCSVLSSVSRARFIPATPYEPCDTETIAGVNEISLAICRAALLAVMEMDDTDDGTNMRGEK